MVGRPALAGFAATLLVGMTSYAASPYVTLYRLERAARAGDVETLRELVDWPSVREGMKQQMAARRAAQADALPAFGASFVKGVASHMIDEHLTPQSLAESVHTNEDTGTGARPARLDWAFFDGPTSFSARLHLPGDRGDMVLRLAPEGHTWKVVGLTMPERS